MSHLFSDFESFTYFCLGGFLKFDMKIFVNEARLEMVQLFTQDGRRGIRVLWTHF